LVGIIDTGVDSKTPLGSIIEKGFDFTGTNALEDNVDHGTAVAALATLGIKPYKVGYRGEIESDEDMINRIKFDVFYIDNWSLILDLKIIVLTVINIIKGEKKAY
jgi:hypothetical protein